MATSQNGWPAFTGWGQAGSTSNPAVPGTDIKIQGGLRSGDVAEVLLHFAAWFHANIETLRAGWCWGIDIRSIRGSSTTSNHQSGTAMDLNAPNHPLGSVGTFSSAQAAKIRAKLREYDGVIRWGGDYSGRKDEMHFEINVSSAAVAAVARRLSGSPAPATPSPKPSAPSTDRITTNTYRIQSGDTLGSIAKRSGTTVKQLAGWNGIPNPDDIPVGKLIRLQKEPVKAEPKTPGFPAGVQYFGPGGTTKSTSLKVWQAQYNRRGWVSAKDHLKVDGIYGPATARAAIVLQGRAGIARDQLIGPATWAAVWKEGI